VKNSGAAYIMSISFEAQRLSFEQALNGEQMPPIQMTDSTSSAAHRVAHLK
jgi:hypothetical protein